MIPIIISAKGEGDEDREIEQAFHAGGSHFVQGKGHRLFGES